MKNRRVGTAIVLVGILTLTMAILALINGESTPAHWAFLVSGPMLLVVGVMVQRRS
ncbi:hypothetical protein [Jannaschia sp. R86511]|uniref:hypothetical protein n=1 Tax=Jannaschia sp. R86511 TaxID=3093853 RepID=UPI0036D2459D